MLLSRLEELIEEMCPDGVEYKSLGEVCVLSAGGDVPKERYSKEVTYEYYVPVYSNGIGDNAHYGYTDIAKIKERCVTIAARGTIGYCELRKEPFYPVVRLICAVPKKELIADFLKYCIEIIKFQVPTSGIPQLTVPMVSKYKIPLPPLEIQREIVRVLDDFTELTTEITAEITAEIITRKKQYEYYRNSLLAFSSDDIKWFTLGEIGPVCMCKRIMKAETSTDGEVPFYKIGTFGKEANAYISQETYEKYKSMYKFPKKGDILISAAGTIGRTVVYDGTPAYFQDSNIVWIDNDESIVLNKFLIYCYAMKPWNVSTGGTIARLYNDNILKAKIPVPSLEEQEKIVSIIEKFSMLSNNISESLPAEIEARQKQYEYYRDKLLTFKELGA